MIVLTVLLALYVVADLYICYRFVRNPEIDWTAGVTWYWVLKWAVSSQTKAMVTKLPFLSQDLTEALNITAEDGEVT